MVSRPTGTTVRWGRACSSVTTRRLIRARAADSRPRRSRRMAHSYSRRSVGEPREPRHGRDFRWRGALPRDRRGGRREPRECGCRSSRAAYGPCGCRCWRRVHIPKESFRMPLARDGAGTTRSNFREARLPSVGAATLTPTPNARAQRSRRPRCRRRSRSGSRRSPGQAATVTHRWAALVGYTADGLPVLEQVRPRIWATGGYSGTGNLLGAVCGRAAAQLALGAREGSPLD